MNDLYPKIEGLCSLCKTPLTGRSRRWCSRECANGAFMDLMIRCGYSQFIRKAVFERDNGICANCRLDTMLLSRIWRHCSRGGRELIENMISGYRLSFWDADHIVEIADGGEHDLDNLQTLCLKCHKQKND